MEEPLRTRGLQQPVVGGTIYFLYEIALPAMGRVPEMVERRPEGWLCGAPGTPSRVRRQGTRAPSCPLGQMFLKQGWSLAKLGTRCQLQIP